MDKFEEQMQRKEYLINRLNEIRLYKSTNYVPKESKEHADLRNEQFIIEQELSTIRIFFRNATRKVRHETNQEYLRTHPKTEIPKYKKILDTYTGVRCEYCGGETDEGYCSNDSSNWPHPHSISLLSNVQSIVSTE